MALGVTREHLFNYRKGKHSPPPHVLYRLALAENEAGIGPKGEEREAIRKAAAAKLGFGPKNDAGWESSVVREDGPAGIRTWEERALRAEAELERIKAMLRSLSQPAKSDPPKGMQ